MSELQFYTVGIVEGVQFYGKTNGENPFRAYVDGYDLWIKNVEANYMHGMQIKFRHIQIPGVEGGVVLIVFQFYIRIFKETSF